MRFILEPEVDFLSPKSFSLDFEVGSVVYTGLFALLFHFTQATLHLAEKIVKKVSHTLALMYKRWRVTF